MASGPSDCAYPSDHEQCGHATQVAVGRAPGGTTGHTRCDYVLDCVLCGELEEIVRAEDGFDVKKNIRCKYLVGSGACVADWFATLL